MNSGLVGALGAAPLQTVKARLGSFQGRSHVFFPLSRDSSFVIGGQPPDGSINGGNKRGVGAVDLQLLRLLSSNVASGNYSFVAGGRRTTASGLDAIAFQNGSASGSSSVCFGGNYDYPGSASGTGSFAFGEAASASGNKSVSLGSHGIASADNGLSLGFHARADRAIMAWSSGRFGAGNGEGFRQAIRANFANTTTNNTPQNITLGVPSGKVISCLINLVGIKSDGSSVAQYIRKCCIKNVGGTTSLVGSVEIIGTDYEDNPLTDVTITASDITDTLNIAVTGISSETWRWCVTIDGTELAYGT